MKIIKYKWFIASGLIILTAIAACKKDFLNRPPLGSLSPSVVTNQKGVEGLLIGAYAFLDGTGGRTNSNWSSASSNWVYGSVVADDAYKGSDPSDVGEIATMESWQTTATTGGPGDKWSAMYEGVQRANEVLRIMALATDIKPETRTLYKAEALFLRGFYHSELKKMFNMIPFVDETINLSKEKDVTNAEDAWPRIEADLQFAVDSLPETQAQAGRANKWAAMAFLAKAYLFDKSKGYSAALPLLNDIIANGKTSKGEKYALVNYFSNFNPAQKNNAETVFAVQNSVKDGSSIDWGGAPNGNYGDILNFPYSAGPGGCCGFFNPSRDLTSAYKTNPATGLPLLDNWFEGPSPSDPVGRYTGTLDPRVDLSIGRPGIPYLDWGPVPTDDKWIRNPSADYHNSPKKNVYAKSQASGYTDVGSSYWGPTELTANQVNLIRFADVLLWAAEAEVQVGDPNKALAYVNMVRARAADPKGWVYKNSDYSAGTATYSTQTTPADNYVIKGYPPGAFTDKNYAMKAIMFERRLELAMEGHRFFDLVRWGIADQVLNAYAQRDGNIVPYMKGATFTKGKNEYYPIPQGERDLFNKDGTDRLKQNPNY
jgi:surface antigen